jgi:hypothetical protein
MVVLEGYLVYTFILYVHTKFGENRSRMQIFKCGVQIALRYMALVLFINDKVANNVKSIFVLLCANRAA